MIMTSSGRYLGKSQHIARRLLAQLAEADLDEGETFSTEARLLEQFGVSRPTLREAVRIVESLGVLEQRPGPGGGLVARRPSLDTLTHGLSVYLRFNNVAFASVLQARELIEPALAAEAARQGSEADFRDMEASIERMGHLGEDQSAFVAENRTFHSLVARAGGNKVLEAFWGSISLLADGEHHGVRYSFGNRQHVLSAHRQILDACRRRDPAGAASAMAGHVGELEHLVRDRYRHLLGKPTGVRSPDASSATNPQGALA
jgi:DNA-binding FadR family transcriptional regulator